MKTGLHDKACRGALIGLLTAGFVASAGERMASFESSGWKGVEIGTEYGAAKEAFAKAGVAFEDKTVHKDVT